jgi:hypothetical protein
LSAPDLGATQLLTGDTTPAASLGAQENPKIARGGNQSLAVWVDRRTATSSAANGNVYFGDGIGSMNDVLAARLDASGNVVDTTPIVISQADYNQTEPQVAWNGSTWLVTWMTERDQYYSDVKAVRVGADGTVLDASPIVLDTATTSINQFPPYTVSSDGTNWSVMWKDLDSTGSKWILVGSKVAPDGTVMNPGGRMLRQTFGNDFIGFADLAFAGDEYLGTWLEYGADAVSPVIKAQRFDLNLNPVGAPVTVDNYSQTHAYRPNVATDGTNFLVTWSEDRFAYRQVFAARISHAGAVLDPNGIEVTPYGIATTSHDNDVMFDGTNYVVVYNDQPSETNFDQDIHAQRISPAGTLVGAPIIVDDAPNNQQRPAVAPVANGGVQAVWLDWAAGTDSDINGAQIAADGAVSAIKPISTGAPRQLSPALASNGNGYLAVFRSEISGQSRIVGQRLTAAGDPIDAQPFTISSAGNTLGNPDVAWNGSEYLVTWNDGKQVQAKRIAADGAVIDAAPIAVMPGIQPVVEALGTTFLVADVNAPVTPQQQYTFVARVSATGAVLDAPIRIGTSFDTSPAIATVGNRWLVAWQNAPTHDSPLRRVFADFVDANGSAGTVFTVASDGGLPDVATEGTGNSALIVYDAGSSTARNVFGRRVNADGSQSAAFTISAAPNAQQSAAVAWDGNEFVADWIDFRNYNFPQQQRTDIYGARIAADNTVLDPNGFAISSAVQPDETPTVGGTSGSALFSCASYRPESPFGAFRIATRQLRSPVAFAHIQNRTLMIDGTEGDDVIAMGSSDGGTSATVSMGASTMSFAQTDFDAVNLNALGGDDRLDFNGGVAQPITFSGGAGASTITVSDGTLTLRGDAAAADVVVNDGGAINFNDTQHLSSLDIKTGGIARLTAGGQKVLVTRSLALAGTGQLDLNDNDLIVDYASGASSPMSAIQGLINSARSGGAWNGSGLTSSAARGNSNHTTTLGAMEASDFATIYGSAAQFGGEPLDGSAVLVKYTYSGDSDFNGKVNFDDYVRTDLGFNNHRSGWSNGDFDGNSSVNFDDYVLIDLAFNSGGPTL